MAALALFYCGRVYYEQQRYEEATKAYLAADHYAQTIKDYHLRGLINANLGWVNYEKLLLDEAITYYKQAQKYFCRNPDSYHKEALAFISIGNCFLVNGQHDSTLYYLEKGLEFAVLHGDSTMQSSIYQAMGVAFQEKGIVAKAHTHFLQAAYLGADVHNKVRLYRELARSCLMLGKRDSALYYVHLISLPEMLDTTAIGQASTYELLSDLKEQLGCYQEALEYHKQYVDYLDKDFEVTLNNSILEVQKKYQLEQVENKHNRKTILLQRIIMVSLGLLLATALAYLWMYRRYLRVSEQLREKQTEMVALMEQAKREEEKWIKRRGNIASIEANRMLNDLRQQRLNRLKKASLLKSRLNPESRSKLKDILLQFDQIIYGSKQGTDWQLLYRALNELYDGALDKLQLLLPQLSEAEFRVCCLSYAQFDNTEASIVLNVSSKTILNHRTAIRKKLGLADAANIHSELKILSQNENVSS